jgi:PKD repeat protein
VIVLNNALVITQPAILRATVTPTMVTCFGANDGIITITNSLGGYGTYEYSNNGGTTWQSSGTFSGLAPANYDVRIRDAANTLCEIVLNPGVAITEPAVLNAVVASVNISCTGSNSGIITISSASGGYGTYEYSINGGTSWQVSGTFSSLAPGFYDVRIRDRAHIGCVIVLNPALQITETASLSATVASADVTCNGANDGTITISGSSGGTGTYGYTINGGASWQTSGTFTNVAPGTYNVRIRDAASITCEIVLNPALVITQPAKLAALVASTNVTCFGANDGTITITSPTGGYGTYEYSVDGGANWQAGGSFTALAPGFYNVQIRDAAHITCIVTLNGSLRITEPPVLSANVTSFNVTCNGANDGRIIISGPTGGYGTYEFSVSGGASWQASGTFTNLTPGSFNIQIRDAAHTGCVIILNPALVISEPAILTATVASVDVTCFGANNGIITITGAAGGYGTYEYSINGGTTWSGLNNFTNLAPGTYDVRIRDAAHTGCVITLNGSLIITQPAVLDADVAKTNVTCFGGSDGTITITNPTGGYGTYEYSVNGGGSWQASGVFTALGPGNYNVQIRDAAHLTCVIVLDNALQITQPAILNAVISTTMVTCNGASDGIINITSPTGGYGTYEYSNNGGTSWQASGTFTGLAPATYDVRIRDAVNTGCVITLNPSVMITEPSVLNAVVTSVNVTCFGANNGIITISSPTGGYGTYEYTVTGGGAWQTTGTFSNLAPGTYDVRIRDRAHTGCVIVLNPALVITEPAVLSASVVGTAVTCNGSNDGIITITNPLGGYGTYQYTVNGGAAWQTSGTFNFLAPGTYNVRIRDAANITCEIVLDPALAITQPAKLAASVSSSNVTCYGANDGTISITAPTGGYGTYEYSIDGGTGWQAGGSFTALAPGFYNVQIRDAAHPACVVILNGSLRITEPAVLSANVVSTAVTCNGLNNGTITITSPMGGYGTYEYSNNGGTSWQSPGTFSNLAPGTYDIRIRDAANIGCVIVLNPALVITEPAVLNATVTSVNVSCFGANDGSISVSAPTGGYGTYQYSDNGGTTWQGFGNFTNLTPGTYDVRIRDAANTGCVITLAPALVITQPAILAANITSTNVTCFGGNDGTITINGATGGYGTYEYSINGGGSWQAPGTFNNLAPGTYNVMIRDAAHAGCIIVLNNAYMITQPGMLSATISKTEVSCHGNNDGTISITSPSGGYGTYEYSIDGGLSWQASGNYISLAPATYDVRIRDAAHTACSVTLYPNLLITEPVTLSMSSTGDVLLDCFGDMDGMGTFYASGGTMPYTFVVVSNSTGGTIAAPGFNSQTFFNAGAGSVTVSVVDFNGCSAQATINITQPAQLNPGTIAADQVICYGDNPAMLTESSAATGGPSAYNYQWQSSTNIAGPFINIAGATLNQYTPPAGAAYTLYYRRMVTSGICMPQYSNVVEVLVNPRPVALLTGGETICPGQSSVIRVTMLAGTGPFTVEIANHGVVNNYISGADIVVTPAVTTTYTLTRVRDANNCEVVSPSPNLNGTATVTVSDLPVITSFTPSPAVCEFTLASFKVTATGTNLTYQWFVNEGPGFNAVVDGGTYFGAMTPTLQIFNTVRTMNGFVYHVTVSGCGTSVTSADAVFTVNTAPELTLHPKDSTICLGQNAVMEADATGTSVTWKWYVNKGSGFVLSVDDANFSGSATRTLTITNAQSSFNNWVFRAVATGVCGVPVNTNFAVLRVVNPPAVTLQPVAHTICENGSTSFLGNGTGYTSLQWQVFSGGVWTNLTDNATYIGTNTQQLAIMNAPVALNGNQYRLALITGCATTYTNGALLTVNANPVVDFSAVDPISACGGIPVVLNGNPTGGSGTYTQHRWTGDVGPLNSYTVQSPTFNSQITASYNLNYRVTDSNGCTSNDDVTVTVDSPSAQFTQDVDYGCTPLTVTFTKDMTGLAKWWWNFDDGSPLDSLNANPVHTFINNVAGSIGYYNVKLKVRSPGGCYAEFTSTITVYPAVDATFTPNVAVICSGNSITFTALSGATRYFWEYGDGTSGYATHISSHLYTNLTTNPVVHTVKLTTTSFYNCVDVKTFDITVMPVPIPQFTADPLTQVFNAAGNPVTFTNTTNAGTWSWLWRFGDNTSSTAMSPVHSYTDVGTWSVTLVVSNANCSDSVKHSVSVVPPAPVAGFDSIPSGCAPLYVNINNTSLNTEVPGTTYRWDFGDGSLSTAKNPTYTYFTAGTYRIELVVTGPGGTSMATQVVNAYASPKAYFEITPPMVYVNDERVRCFNLSQGATSYLWDFGDGDTSKVKEPYHRYMEEGIFDITLWAYSENGCTDTYVLSPAVTVEPVGELRFSTVFTPNKTGPIERADLPTGGIEVDQFFFPPIRQKVLNYKLQIFNRLGVLIFQSDDINVPWNGYYKGNLCQQGVYVWYVEGKYADGKPFKMVGSVTLLQ